MAKNLRKEVKTIGRAKKRVRGRERQTESEGKSEIGRKRVSDSEIKMHKRKRRKRDKREEGRKEGKRRSSTVGNARNTEQKTR